MGVNATWGRPDMPGTHERFGQSGVLRTPGAARSPTRASVGVNATWGRPDMPGTHERPAQVSRTSVPWVSPSSAAPNAGSGTGTQSGQRHPMRYLARRVVAVANRRE